MAAPQTIIGKKATSKKVAIKPTAKKIPHTSTFSTGNKFGTFLRLMRGSPMDLVSMTREGLPAMIFGTAAEYLDMSKSQLYKDLRLSRSTLESRMQANQALTPDEGDKIIRIAKVLERAAGVLEGEDSAKQWLRHEIRSIGGVQPITLLDTEAGYELVMDTLGRIEHGIAA